MNTAWCPLRERDANLTSMRNNSFLIPILLLCVCHTGASQNSAPGKSAPVVQSAPKLKSVELDRKYTIQVPDYFTVNRLSDRIAAVPIYAFSAAPPKYTSIRVSISPQSGLIPIDKETGKFKLPLAADDGTPLTNYFAISGNRDVYYGWRVVDNAYECSMNSECPSPQPPESRYTTEYAFTLFDKLNNLIVEFTGSHDGPSGKVTGFEGDGRLLRETIVPSLVSVQ